MGSFFSLSNWNDIDDALNNLCKEEEQKITKDDFLNKIQEIELSKKINELFETSKQILKDKNKSFEDIVCQLSFH